MNRPPPPTPSNRRSADEGTLYRVVDRQWNVYGENLTWPDAQRLLGTSEVKQQSQRTASCQPMSTPLPTNMEISYPFGRPEAPQTVVDDDLSVPEDAPPVPEAAPQAPVVGTEYVVGSETTTTITANGVITRIPSGFQLLVNGTDRPVPVGVVKGDEIQCRPQHPAVVTARAAGAQAAAAVIAAKRRVPMDVTVRAPVPRTAPPPRDVTLSNKPVLVRLGAPPAAPPKPLPSPLKVATVEDGDPLSDDAISDAEIPDLAADLGGGASDADVEHAKRQAEAERAE